MSTARQDTSRHDRGRERDRRAFPPAPPARPAAAAGGARPADGDHLIGALQALMRSMSTFYVARPENDQRWKQQDQLYAALNGNVVELTKAVNALSVKLPSDYASLDALHRLEDKVDTLTREREGDARREGNELRQLDNRVSAQSEGFMQRSISLWQGLMVSGALILFSITISWIAQHIHFT